MHPPRCNQILMAGHLAFIRIYELFETTLIDRNGDSILYYYVDMGMGALQKVKIDVFCPESFFVYFEDVLYLRLFVSSNRCTFNSS